jgi:para-nitrobenzyl esterase
MREWPFLLGLVGLSLAGVAQAADPVVSTTGGRIAGTREGTLQVFRGIPYAAPPLGDLRWREPRMVKPWQGVRDAKAFSPSCTQAPPTPAPPYTAGFLISGERSEDCLYLNVWALSGRTGKRPVYVFIHGGAFQAGSADVRAYDGAALARKGAVVVTINYRLGMLGFFAHPDLTRESPFGTSGNYGILDAIAALRWVRDNIGRFGGDPGRVTIAGQSAGAAAVNALLVSPMAEGLFHRAVLESGPIIGLPLLPLTNAEANGVASVKRAAVADIAGLRAIPATDLAKLNVGIPFPIADGKVIPANPESPASRIVSRVPQIIGYTRDESGTAANPVTAAAFESDVRKRFGVLAERVLAIYPHASDAEASRSNARLGRDRRTAAMLLWGERRRAEGIAVYAYQFEKVFPGPDAERLGAFHSAELPYVFGTFDIPDARFTADDRTISAAMQDRWLAFMKSGNPSPGRGKLWPTVTTDPATIWRIAPADSEPLLDAQRLALFREYQAAGGSLGLL